MPINACPHYLPPNAGPSAQCRGCGATVSNPAHPQAQAEGKVHASGAHKMTKAPGG